MTTLAEGSDEALTDVDMRRLRGGARRSPHARAQRLLHVRQSRMRSARNADLPANPASLANRIDELKGGLYG